MKQALDIVLDQKKLVLEQLAPDNLVEMQSYFGITGERNMFLTGQLSILSFLEGKFTEELLQKDQVRFGVHAEQQAKQ